MDTLKVKEEAAEQSDGSDYADAWDDDKWNDAEVGHKPCAGLTLILISHHSRAVVFNYCLCSLRVGPVYSFIRS